MSETTSAGPAGARTLSPAEAFVALLIASARSDGVVSPHEANQIEHVVSGMKLFRSSTFETRYTLFTAVVDRIKAQGVDHVFREAVRMIPKELSATAFALAVDLMLSDGRLTAREQSFTEELREALGVDRDLASRIVDVLTFKNAG